MLKWDHRSERRTRSWVASIRTHRLAVADRIEDSPSLVPRIPKFLTRAHRRARIDAAGATGLDESAFLAACPYIDDAIMTRSIA